MERNFKIYERNQQLILVNIQQFCFGKNLRNNCSNIQQFYLVNISEITLYCFLSLLLFFFQTYNCFYLLSYVFISYLFVIALVHRHLPNVCPFP